MKIQLTLPSQLVRTETDPLPLEAVLNGVSPFAETLLHITLYGSFEIADGCE